SRLRHFARGGGKHSHVRPRAQLVRARRDRDRGGSGADARVVVHRSRRQDPPRVARGSGERRGRPRERRRGDALPRGGDRGLLVCLFDPCLREANRRRRDARPRHLVPRLRRARARGRSGGAPMNVLEARVVLRDRTFLDVIDLAVRFLVRYWRAYAKLAAIVLPLPFLLTWGVAALGGWGWGWTVAILLSPFVAAPFTALAS